MIDLKNIQRIYFLGIGGIGMSALARYFNLHGKTVTGYDKTSTTLTRELEKEGIHITFEDKVETLDKEAELIIYTPAIPTNHLQYNWYIQNKFTILKRAQILGLAANSMFNISIGGSHGKTSTSSIAAHILKTANKSVAAFLGGICVNFNSNFIDGNEYAVAEADEFDRSFLNLKPNIALITSVDTDHLDIYGNLEAIEDSFHQFCKNVHSDGKLITHIHVADKILNKHVQNYRYSLDNSQADYYAKNLSICDGTYTFDVVHPNGIIENVISYYGGKHNIENAIGAIAIALNIGISAEDIRCAIASFKGVKRRFETHVRNENVIYIDDYAHHPRELDATISATKELYPSKKITVIFQPHLFSRTNDLCDEFALSLSKADKLILLDIYPAREKPIEGVSSRIIFDKVSIDDKHLSTKDEFISFIKSQNDIEVVLTVGAGDIDTKINELKTYLETKK
ncbi:MAG TPA: UDP-N-acetylmuramate--L-alanine ligase [Chitinophagales bacterium]|nr:UDP-N-acetylmuramate--L-alanine ligase [Chitinophagales bacterium]HQV77976.1 UDP-N-acetylmuramate--L-alanine ligase [Chitinophagales bacterium]HQW78698.1 UDP-N-acetylmuramate--L-alanine ligase [Chitinophagales bacterium]HRB18504.1 UDP-N-acetylmuramate--L-alanine ligase [Chitinophagales bacterium]HRB66295.1 UDP-N-acetylmuramate--L-alanine ligase [Chitinophagales bacterium]